MSAGRPAGGSHGPTASALSTASPLHAAVLAALHAESAMDRPWSTAEMHGLLRATGCFGFVAEADGRPGGFLLARAAGGEAEILMLAVLPRCRRRGLGRFLLDAGCRRARELGASSMLLEVAADNQPALSLYRGAGFTMTSVRPRYYDRAEGPPVDAVLMRRDLAGELDS